jgi:hypothetical protein
MTNPIVERDAVIIKTRRLPAPGEVLVSLGDKVRENTPIARGIVRNTELVEIRADRKLGVDAMDVAPYMLKREGDVVKKDEVIALRRSFFGSSTKVLRAPLDGTIEAFSGSTGKLLIRGLPIPIEVKAHVPGKITELFPLEGAVVECKGNVARGAVGVGGEARGPLEILVDGPGEILTESPITKNHAGMVVVGGATATPEALRKARSVGVAALIVGGIDEKELTEFLGHELNLGDTGSEQIDFILISLAGFGAESLDEEALRLFREHVGRLACVDGTTQIRTRMLRPEIILPL